MFIDAWLSGSAVQGLLNTGFHCMEVWGREWSSHPTALNCTYTLMTLKLLQLNFTSEVQTFNISVWQLKRHLKLERKNQTNKLIPTSALPNLLLPQCFLLLLQGQSWRRSKHRSHSSLTFLFFVHTNQINLSTTPNGFISNTHSQSNNFLLLSLFHLQPKY